jgi:hypothetical protein
MPRSGIVYAEWFASVSLKQIILTKSSFGSHHEDDQNILPLRSIEHSTRRDNDLSIGQVRYLWRDRPRFRKVSESFNSFKYSLHVPSRSIRLIERDVFGNRFQVIKCGLGPDQAIHRFILLLA